MKRSRKVRHALITSLGCLALSCALLTGTTFAWFTDSVTNTGNSIQAGTLSIELNDGDTSAIFGSDATFLWEPGRSQKAAVKLENTGNLWLKYALSFANVNTDGKADITEVLDVYKVDKTEDQVSAADLLPENRLGTIKSLMAADELTQAGVLAPAGYSGNDGSTTANFTLVIKMQETAGNKYQDCTVSFDVVVAATQYTYEADGFGSTRYDEDATLNFLPVSDAAGLSAALAEGKTAVLTEDIVLTEKIEVTGNVAIDGNGHSITNGVDRVLDIHDQTKPITITLSNVDLVGPTTGTDTRGISLYKNSGPVTLIMDNCSASANYYAINLASANANVKVVVRNSEITGWCAFQTHSPNADITFENCTLKGINDKSYNEDGWNDFATIVINGYTEGNPDLGGAHDCTLTFKNCRIEATQTTSNHQRLFSVRAMDTVINLENCTFYVDGTQIDANDIGSYIGVSSEEIAESLIINLS